MHIYRNEYGTKARWTMRVLMTLLTIHCSLFTSAAPNDSIIVYNETRPLIYEDAWDLWPYVFLNENGEPDGYNIDLLKMIFKELDIPYVIKLKPTLEAQADLRDRKSDLMLRMDASFSRNNASFGKSIVQLFTHSIVTPKEKKLDIQKGEQLANYSVIVHDGSYSHYYLKDNRWATDIDAYDDMQEAIQKVAAEDEGIIVWNTMSLKWLMQKFHTDNLQLTPIDIPYGEYKFFANDHHLLAQLDSVYSQLRANDRLVPIQNKWFYPERTETGIPSWIWQFVTFLGIIFLAIVINYILYKVREQKMTKEVRKSNDRLSLILKTSQVSFWTYQAKTQVYTVMDQQGRPVRDYTSLEFSQLYQPSDFIKLTDALKQIIEDQTDSITLELRARSDEEAPEESYYRSTLAVLRRDKKNKPAVIICSESNITQEKMRKQTVKDTMLRYQSIFNSAMIDMVYYNEKGIITDMNQKAIEAIPGGIEFIRSLNITVQQVLGIGDFRLEDFDHIYLTQIYTSADDERPLNRILKRDKLYYELQLMPVRDSKNHLMAIFGTGRDVTELALSHQQQKENTLKLQQANQEITEYIENIDYVLSYGGISMVRYSLNNHILTIYSEINRERYALTQTRAMSFVEKNSQKQALRILNRMDSQQPGAIHVDIKTIIRKKGDMPLYLQLHFIPTYKDGEIVEYFGMCRDISDIKLIEEKLAQETLHAQEVETVKNAFLHNMSHEIRTPLNSVVGFSELFEMEHTTEDETIFIQQIKESSAALLKLINDILFLSRMDAGMIAINKRSIDFASIFDGRCESIWANSKVPGVEYLTKNPYKRLVIEVDEPHIYLMMDKIITNAVQHTTKGTVLARYDYIGDLLVISVEDSGSGIPESAIEHIFERFVTGANTGVGLGLSICHELIERMGGKIQLKSEEGKGTTVWFSLPCKVTEMERI